MNRIALELSKTPGDTFFEVLAKNIGETLGIKYCLIGNYHPLENEIHSRVFWGRDGYHTPFSFKLPDTPCDYVIKNKKTQLFQGNIPVQFPKTQFLLDLDITSYLGVPLLDRQQRVIGHLAILDDKEFEMVEDWEKLLTFFSERASWELERSIREKKLDETNRELQKYIDSNLQLEKFAYIASHDLKEPLRNIASFSQLFTERYGHLVDEKGQCFLYFINSGAKRMRNYIDGLITFSKVENEPIISKKIDLNIFFKGLKQNFEREIFETNGKLHIDPMPEEFYGSRFKLEQVFQNLISNSLKFKQEHVPPDVKISYKDVGQFFKFSVSDNGIGIDAKFHQTVFGMFKRLHPNEKFEGTGIGLALVKKIISQSGGTVWIESGKGAGTKVHFTLPKHSTKEGKIS